MAYFHKLFNRLSLYISDKSLPVLPFKQMLATQLTTLYSSKLAGPSFNGIYRINIYLTDVPAEDGYLLEEGGFLDFYSLFDFNLLVDLHIKERKQYLLDNIHEAVIRIVREKGWETTRFERAYQECLGSNMMIEIIK